MFRGETISGDDPALSLSVSLDDASGLFAGASASLAAGGENPRVVGSSQYAGFALRRAGTSLEAGIIHRRYARIADPEYRRDFVEAYVGVSHAGLRARLYVSPDYARAGPASYYAELDTRLLARGEWSLDGHLGLSLLPPDRAAGESGLQRHADWRLQLSRPLGGFFASAGLAGTGYPVYSTSGRARLFFSLARAF